MKVIKHRKFFSWEGSCFYTHLIKCINILHKPIKNHHRLSLEVNKGTLYQQQTSPSKILKARKAQKKFSWRIFFPLFVTSLQNTVSRYVFFLLLCVFYNDLSIYFINIWLYSLIHVIFIYIKKIKIKTYMN